MSRYQPHNQSSVAHRCISTTDMLRLRLRRLTLRLGLATGPWRCGFTRRHWEPVSCTTVVHRVCKALNRLSISAAEHLRCTSMAATSSRPNRRLALTLGPTSLLAGFLAPLECLSTEHKPGPHTATQRITPTPLLGRYSVRTDSPAETTSPAIWTTCVSPKRAGTRLISRFPPRHIPTAHDPKATHRPRCRPGRLRRHFLWDHSSPRQRLPGRLVIPDIAVALGIYCWFAGVLGITAMVLWR